MLSCIDTQIDKAQEETPIGWAIAIAGTIRSAYYTSGGDHSYGEGEAHLLPTPDEAWAFVKAAPDYEKFQPYLKAVPALESVRKQNPYRQGLPTLNGCHPNPFEQEKAKNPELDWGEYLLLSQIFYHPTQSKVSLTAPNESSAELLRIVDKVRPYLSFKNNQEFNEQMKVHVKDKLKLWMRSPDWILALHYAHNPRRASLNLRKLLDRFPIIPLPITLEWLDTVGLPIGDDLRSEATAIALFEY